MLITKKITIRGQEYMIAPLTAAQTEVLTEPLPDGSNVKAWRARAWQTLEDGMNNAISTFHRGVRDYPEGATPFSADDLKHEIDLPTFQELHAAILDLSGLRASTPGEPEAVAGSGSTGETSAGA